MSQVGDVAGFWIFLEGYGYGLEIVGDRNGRGREVKRTDAMNMPKRPPMPKPITPDIADLPKQDSIIAFIWKVRVSERQDEDRYGITWHGMACKGTYGFDIGVIGIICPPRRRRGAESWEVVHRVRVYNVTATAQKSVGSALVNLV